MGDCCYMEVTCRVQDRERFEALDFHLSETRADGLLDMVDDEANCAHCDEMPKDIPYYGWNGSGGNYGSGEFACDGKEFAEVETGYDTGCYVLEFDTGTCRPTEKSLAAIRKHFAVRQAAMVAMAPQVSGDVYG